jgi:hypothetical protein
MYTEAFQIAKQTGSTAHVGYFKMRAAGFVFIAGVICTFFTVKIGMAILASAIIMWLIGIFEKRIIYIRLERDRFKLIGMLKSVDIDAARNTIYNAILHGYIESYRNNYSSYDEMMLHVNDFVANPDIVTAIQLIERYPAFSPHFESSK